MKLLHIDSSVLAEKSVTRVLSAEMVEAERRLHPGLEVTYRDLAAQPLQHFSGGHVAVAHGAPPIPGLDLPASSAVLEEFLAADILVIGAPMYNFTIPSQLKTWIDRLVLAGKTFKYENGRPVGLVTGKKMLVASSRGGAYAGTPIEFLDHQESYLKAIFGFLGVSDITFVRAENMSRPDLRDKSIADAKARIGALAA